MSTRVIRKSFGDLNQLPREQASKLLKNELDSTLSEYLLLYDALPETLSDGGVPMHGEKQTSLWSVRKNCLL